jgi:hypothetical protein
MVILLHRAPGESRPTAMEFISPTEQRIFVDLGIPGVPGPEGMTDPPGLAVENVPDLLQEEALFVNRSRCDD